MFESASVSGEGHLGNVSEHGMFVRTDELPKTGERVRMELRTSTGSIELEGEVRWSSADREGAQTGFGVRLLEVTPAYTGWLRSIGVKPARER